jgi:hypothetical protein
MYKNIEKVVCKIMKNLITVSLVIRYLGESFIHSFIHSAVCLTTGPKPLPKRALYIVRSIGSYFRSQYPLVSLRPFSSFLRLLPRLPVTSIPPFIFPSITCHTCHIMLLLQDTRRISPRFCKT